MKVCVSVFVCLSVLFGSSVSALKCYRCDSNIQGTSCSNPEDFSKVDSGDCAVSGRPFDVRIGESDAPEVLKDGEEFQCLLFERSYAADKKKEFVRGCVAKVSNPSYCEQLKSLASVQGYELNQCKTCETDMCNSGRSYNGHMQIALIFVCICLVVRNKFML